MEISNGHILVDSSVLTESNWCLYAMLLNREVPYITDITIDELSEAGTNESDDLLRWISEASVKKVSESVNGNLIFENDSVVSLALRFGSIISVSRDEYKTDDRDKNIIAICKHYGLSFMSNDKDRLLKASIAGVTTLDWSENSISWKYSRARTQADIELENDRRLVRKIEDEEREKAVRKIVDKEGFSIARLSLTSLIVFVLVGLFGTPTIPAALFAIVLAGVVEVTVSRKKTK